MAALLVFFAASHAVTPSDALAAGLFDGMGGAWRGAGSIKWSTGETEAMRCTATYEVTKEGNKITQNLKCATDSTRLVVTSNIEYKPAAGALVGDWREASYGLQGRVSGSASPGSIKALVQSADRKFTARVFVRTNGNQQQVSIQPQGLDVTEVSVSLQKS